MCGHTGANAFAANVKRFTGGIPIDIFVMAITGRWQGSLGLPMAACYAPLAASLFGSRLSDWLGALLNSCRSVT